MPEPMTFGSQIAEARKALGMSQKDLAAKITKEDGEAISPQYLNDIEHDRRNPPSEDMIYQFAKELKLEPEVLFYLAGKLPQDLTKASAEHEKIVAAYQAFRKALKK
jgi:transcriptional regulator with XRE-family HTH domain